MTDWEKFWNTVPRAVGERDYFRQVMKTVRGEPLTERQFQYMVSEVCERLELKETDRVLDLCCGNGLITKEIAKVCRAVVGVDFSQPLIEVANRDHRPANVTYWRMSALDLDQMPLPPTGPFNKVLLYDALQHFAKRDLSRLLRNILAATSEGRLILLGGIPDKRRQWRFYNTPQKKLLYLTRKVTGKDALGTWWERDFIRATCQQLNLQCAVHEQSKEMYNAHFRFDVAIF
jgi:cyclopropane fatty-acyl-phospholipid synthase-like methyltransferase